MDTLHALIQTYKADPESVYNTWFVSNEDRLKAFRAIRRGVLNVIQDIKSGTFGNDFKDSSLEVVLNSITEQKQVFQGAAHPFYWKPKLRIPDIYENEANKQAFGQFLECCLEAKNEEHIVREILKLNGKTIKGLGPAVASILYFLHPTLVPPFNTAIVNGFNALFADKQKLGSWESYLRMREVIIKTNEQYKRALSNDLGAFSGLLFDLGAGKILPHGTAALSDEEREKIARSLKKRHAEVLSEHDEENLHTEMQYHLLKIGKSLGYDVVCAANDRSRAFGDHKFSFLCLPALPPMSVDKDTFSTISLIDVLWLEVGTNNVVCAFEVEKSTSIYSGILRLTDLAISQPDALKTLFIVMPNDREKDVVLQLRRPAVQALKSSGVEMHYIAFSDLREHCDAICKFGKDHAVMQKIAKTV
jgi:type II restriction enzyme